MDKKYIDAEELYKQVDSLMARCAENEKVDDEELSIFYQGKSKMCSEVLKIIDSLQQEQLEVDLEKELQEHIKECLDVKFPTTDIELIRKDVAYTARKFYELGQSIQYQKDRREFSKLKAKEWKEGFDAGYEKGLRKENKK